MKGPSMAVRQAVEEDFEQLLRLLDQLNPGDVQRPELQKRAFQEILASSNLALVVAEEYGAIRATCYLNVLPNMTRGGRPYALIENVVTDSDHRGKGYGKSVVKRALEMAWEAGCYKVMLLSGRSGPSVRAFYIKCGFVPDEKQGYVQRAL